MKLLYKLLRSQIFYEITWGNKITSGDNDERDSIIFELLYDRYKHDSSTFLQFEKSSNSCSTYAGLFVPFLFLREYFRSYYFTQFYYYIDSFVSLISIQFESISYNVTNKRVFIHDSVSCHY